MENKWFCVQFFRASMGTIDRTKPYRTEWLYHRNTTDACEAGKGLLGGDFVDNYYEVHEVRPELVPAVIRGLKEATTEEIRDELAIRDWKVTTQ